MTDAELRLWTHLRGRNFAGLKFRRQVPMGAYIADFFCAEARLVVEMDGSQHYLPNQISLDRQRTEWFERRGIEVLRFSSRDVLTNISGVCDAIGARIGGTAQPSP